MDQNTQNQQERREARRKRRIRNQILAYITVFIFILAMAAGIVYGVRYLKQESLKNTQAQQDQEEQVSQMLSEEESSSQPETESSETVPELTREQKLDQLANALIDEMPLEDKVAGLFIVTPESITGVSTAVKAGNGTKDALTKYAVGGIIYSTKNIQTESQFKEMIDTTKLYSSYPLFIAVEDEGGKISPLSEKKLVAVQPSASELAENGDADKTKEVGVTIGTYLSEYGFNLDFAPVADIASVENSVMKSRVYGQTADQAKPLVASMVEGLKEKQISTCLKHFPGMGSTTQDTDAGLASTDRSAEDFRANEFTVFQAGIDAGADMITFHAEAAKDIAACISMIKKHGVKAGLAISPGTPIDVVLPHLPRLDMVLCMTVEPGYGGQRYIKHVNDKIRALREIVGEDFLIQIDGGVDSRTIKMPIEAGANVIVAGSAVFNGNITKNLKELKQCAQS